MKATHQGIAITVLSYHTRGKDTYATVIPKKFTDLWRGERQVNTAELTIKKGK